MEKKKSGCQCALEASNAVLTPRTVDQYKEKKKYILKKEQTVIPASNRVPPKTWRQSGYRTGRLGCGQFHCVVVRA